ncbi:hypothetical protein [Pseudonocardia sp. TMWB2A]
MSQPATAALELASSYSPFRSRPVELAEAIAHATVGSVADP